MFALLALLAPALALEPGGSQTLLYDLRIGERFVGTRAVTLRFLQTDQGEVRVIESYTELEAGVAGVPLRFENRASAQLGSRAASFTSSVAENGKVREVQGRRRSDGTWRVTVIEGGAVQQASLPPSAVDLSSLELLDPVRHRELTGRPRAEILAVETGTLLAGAVTDRGEGTLSLGGVEVPVHRWTWEPEGSRVELAWTVDGVLASYTSTWMGQALSATLRAPPEARSFGDIGDIPQVVEDVGESEL